MGHTADVSLMVNGEQQTVIREQWCGWFYSRSRQCLHELLPVVIRLKAQ